MNNLQAILLKYMYIVLLTLTPISLAAQNLNIPRVSPKSSVSQYIGVTNISIEYSRPSVKERHIFGDLIPYSKVWRTGANEATTISFSHSAKIEGITVPSGKYAIFTIPGKDG